ncbi:tetratricopeptide repeat protein [Dechloromonas sp. ZY10]|uniref:tetratricopeptide repeat protein n=1 Tax=Dechloromonas aquae TaxID=2664436 RepID=UPI003528CFD0
MREAGDDELEVLFARGLGRLQGGDPTGAVQAFAVAREIAPGIPEIHANLALAHEACGNIGAAQAAYREALWLAPDDVQILLNYGALLTRQQQFGEAELSYRQALELQPDHPAIWSNLGVLYACLQREILAEDCYRQALELDPAHRNSQFNLAYLLLRQGRLNEGWQRLEARDSRHHLLQTLALPEWQGQDLRGRRIVIAAEGGHGDMLHFGRYGACLKAAGAASVGIVAYPGLRSLFLALSGVDRVLAHDTPLTAAEWDYWVAPLSLPGQLGGDAGEVPAQLPYLRVDTTKYEYWHNRLPRSGQRRIGLVWQGNPQFANDRQRSLPTPELLAPLLALPDCEFFSLHRDGAAPLAGVCELGAELADFSDSAAALQQLDLLISVDTALVHLAGALARPCWMMLPAYQTDWRWGKQGTESLWYPQVLRLYRQPAPGDWRTVIDRIAEDLRQFTGTAR